MTDKYTELSERLWELEVNATPGPWERWKEHGTIFQGPLTKNTAGHCTGGTGLVVAECGDPGSDDMDESVPPDAEYNADLIVFVRNNLPLVLSALEDAARLEWLKTQGPDDIETGNEGRWRITPDDGVEYFEDDDLRGVIDAARRGER